MGYQQITAAQCSSDPELSDWRVTLTSLAATFTCATFSQAGELAAQVAQLADARDHHPSLDLRYPGKLLITMTTHFTGGLTDADTGLAKAISALAGEVGAAAEPGWGQQLELALDTAAAQSIRPFWLAVLDYRQEADGSLTDPRGQGPALWFQAMEPPRTGRGRFHLDISVPHDVAEQRLAAALAAGGRLVSDAHAPSFWVLADAENNEACICTWQGRP